MSKKNSIWVGILHMGLGTVLAQMINIVVQPILTRVFPAETLGIYTYLISLATMIIPVASLKLDMLIVSEPNEKEAQYITDACIIINILISLIYAIVIIVGYQVSDNNIFNKYGIIIYVVPILVFTNGLRFLFISYLNRYKEYKTISIIAIIREAIRAVIQVGAGFLSLGVFSLSMGYAVSPLFGLNIQMRNYLKELKERPRINLKKFKEIVLVKGKRQILFLVPAQFINSFSSSLVTISITALFSAKILGYYSAGVRILDIPIVFITSNVSKVCYQRISENVANKKPVLRTLMSVIMKYQLRRFRNRHKVSDDSLVCDRHGTAICNLSFEQRNHRSCTSKHIAESGCTILYISMCTCTLYDHLAHTLCGTHDICRIDCLIRGYHHKSFRTIFFA